MLVFWRLGCKAEFHGRRVILLDNYKLLGICYREGPSSVPASHCGICGGQRDETGLFSSTCVLSIQVSFCWCSIFIRL